MVKAKVAFDIPANKCVCFFFFHFTNHIILIDQRLCLLRIVWRPSHVDKLREPSFIF